MINLLWSVLANNSTLYQISRHIRIDKNIVKAAFLISIHYLIISLILNYSGVFKYTIHQLVVFYIIVYYLIFAGKICLLMLLKSFRSQGFNTRSTVILGGGRVGDVIRSYLLTEYSFGFKYLGIFDDNPDGCQNQSEVLGSLEDFKAYALENTVDEVFFALPDYAFAKVIDLIRFCEANTIRVKIVPDFMRYLRSKIQLDFYGSIPIIRLRDEPLESLRNRIYKRSFDILFSICVILFILSWLIPLMGILIKLHSKGPIFFTQRRTGLNNKEFNIIKFRTMRVNSEANKKQARKGDPRIFRFGAFLRKSNIDEIPQFINVLLGNMSIIGPRPHMIEHTRYYSEIIDSYMVRQFVKPGLTGWAQVNGFRGDTTRPEQMAGRVKCDVYYIENWSIFLDIRIFFQTIYNMFKGEENAV
jgi:putative colanic acid biosysnthesis UDP-glucose lipid carrier transferase